VRVPPRPGPAFRDLAVPAFQRFEEGFRLAIGQGYPHGFEAPPRRTVGWAVVHLRQGGLSFAVEAAARRYPFTKWLYRPGLGWEAVRRRADSAAIAAAADFEVRADQDPALVPLETLPGRNHYDFPAAEAPPWQWHVIPRYPGWSS